MRGTVVDVGAYAYVATDDYPDSAEAVARAVAEKAAKGILFCGSGVGASIAANKEGACLSLPRHLPAVQGVEHDDEHTRAGRQNRR